MPSDPIPYERLTSKQACFPSVFLLKQDPEQKHAKSRRPGADKSKAIATFVSEASDILWRFYMAPRNSESCECLEVIRYVEDQCFCFQN